MRIPELLLALLLFASFTALADSEALLDAKYRYDLDAAQSVLADTAPAAGLEFAEASLLVAELLRGRYEHDELGRDGRREVGREIDRVAEAALAVLETLPQSSERYRLAADLYGTLIRSRFRGMKYQPKLEQAVDKALELDPKNAHAWVTKARRPLFAKPRHGGDTLDPAARPIVQPCIEPGNDAPHHNGRMWDPAPQPSRFAQGGVEQHGTSK